MPLTDAQATALFHDLLAAADFDDAMGRVEAEDEADWQAANAYYA